MKIAMVNNIGDFYPRSPCGERLCALWMIANLPSISIHALLAESDGSLFYNQYQGTRFLSTLSLRRATSMMLSMVAILILFLSTLSLRRATRRHRGNDRSPIHFYPRSPCGERPHVCQLVLWVLRFLSTLSLRRAT